QRSICSGMHSALIALSASRIYTLLRAEPLKKPSFTLPLIPALGYRSSGSITAAHRLTERKSWSSERGKERGREERKRGMMENMSAKTSRRIRRYIGGDGGRQREERQDKGTTKNNSVAYKGG
ncbi:hypothetical protein ALC53_03097, partial [Atta colombica]